MDTTNLHPDSDRQSAERCQERARWARRHERGSRWVWVWLLSVLAVGSSAPVRGEPAPQEPCASAVHLDGDAALTVPVAEALRRRGIAVDPPLSCPLALVRVDRRAGGLGITINQEPAQGERIVSDPAVAAVLIESWIRSDLTDSLLAVPRFPLAPELAAAVAPAPAPPASAPTGPGFTISLLFEVGIDKDAAVWLGGTLHGCAPVGPICLGAVLRVAADVPPIAVGTLLDQRIAMDVLASVIWPIRRGRWTLAPGLGLGAGWLRHEALSDGAAAQLEVEDRPAILTTAADEGGVRAELRFMAMVRLRAGFHLVSTLALSTSFLEGSAAPFEAAQSLPSAPWLTLHGGLGLAWSAR